jgi:fructose-1,6-bisphosphatase/inositol monophosphatase family enzyme
VSAIHRLSAATVLATGIDGLQALADHAGLARTWGDCYGYLLVATGRAEVMVDLRMGDWDSACLLPIIEKPGACSPTWRAGAPHSAGARSRPMLPSRRKCAAFSLLPDTSTDYMD